MKTAIYAYLTAGIVLTGCNTDPVPYKKMSVQPVVKDTVPELPTTDMVFSFDEKEIPAGFTLDTIFYEDTVKQVSFSIYYFKGLGDSLAAYNKTMHETLMAEVRRQLAYYDVPADKYATSSVEIGPKQVYVDGHFINTQFVNDSYTEGGNHHNYSWYSLNYSRRTGKMLDFKKEFALKAKKDWLDLFNMMGRHLDPFGVEYTAEDKLEPVDFFVRNQVVEFGPYFSWAEGLQSAVLPVDSLKRFLSGTGEIRRGFGK